MGIKRGAVPAKQAVQPKAKQAANIEAEVDVQEVRIVDDLELPNNRGGAKGSKYLSDKQKDALAVLEVGQAIIFDYIPNVNPKRHTTALAYRVREFIATLPDAEARQYIVRNVEAEDGIAVKRTA